MASYSTTIVDTTFADYENYNATEGTFTYKGETYTIGENAFTYHNAVSWADNGVYQCLVNLEDGGTLVYGCWSTWIGMLLDWDPKVYYPLGLGGDTIHVTTVDGNLQSQDEIVFKNANIIIDSGANLGTGKFALTETSSLVVCKDAVFTISGGQGGTVYNRIVDATIYGTLQAIEGTGFNFVGTNKVVGSQTTPGAYDETPEMSVADRFLLNANSTLLLEKGAYANTSGTSTTLGENAAITLDDSKYVSGTYSIATGASITVDANSKLIAQGTTANNGTITVDAAGFLDDPDKTVFNKVVDLNGISGNKVVVTNLEEGINAIISVMGDVILTNADVTHFIVDTRWLGLNETDPIPGKEGFYYNINAYSDLETANYNRPAGVTEDIDVLYGTVDFEGTPVASDLTKREIGLVDLAVEKDAVLRTTGSTKNWGAKDIPTDDSILTVKAGGKIIAKDSSSDLYTQSKSQLVLQGTIQDKAAVDFRIQNEEPRASLFITTNSQLIASNGEINVGQLAAVDSGKISLTDTTADVNGNLVLGTDNTTAATLELNNSALTVHANADAKLYGDITLTNASIYTSNAQDASEPQNTTLTNAGIIDVNKTSAVAINSNFVNNDTVSLKDGSSLTVTNTLTNAGSITIANGSVNAGSVTNNADKTIAINGKFGKITYNGTWTNNGAIDIDLAQATSDVYQIIDYQGSGTAFTTVGQFGTVNLSNTTYELQVVEGDLFISRKITGDKIDIDTNVIPTEDDEKVVINTDGHGENTAVVIEEVTAADDKVVEIHNDGDGALVVNTITAKETVNIDSDAGSTDMTFGTITTEDALTIQQNGTGDLAVENIVADGAVDLSTSANARDMTFGTISTDDAVTIQQNGNGDLDLDSITAKKEVTISTSNTSVDTTIGIIETQEAVNVVQNGTGDLVVTKINTNGTVDLSTSANSKDMTVGIIESQSTVTVKQEGTGNLDIESITSTDDVKITADVASNDAQIDKVTVIGAEHEIVIEHLGKGDMTVGAMTATKDGTVDPGDASENLQQGSNITIINKAAADGSVIISDDLTAKQVKIVNETMNDLAASGKVVAINVIVENNVADKTQFGTINLNKSIAAEGNIDITNGNINAAQKGTISLGGTTEANKHTAAGQLIIKNAINNVINGADKTETEAEKAAFLDITGNVSINNDGHINLNVTSQGTITINNTSNQTLIGEYTGTEDTVTNTGTAQNVTLNATTGDINLINDGIIDTITMTTVDDKKIAISYEGATAPAPITNATVTTTDLWLGGESLQMVGGTVGTVHMGKATATSPADDVAGGVFTLTSGSVSTVSGSLAAVHGSAILTQAGQLNALSISGLDKVTVSGAAQFFADDKNYAMDALELADDASLTWSKTGNQTNIGSAADPADGRVKVIGNATTAVAFNQSGEYALNDLDLNGYAGNVDVADTAALNLAYADALAYAATLDIAAGGTVTFSADQTFTGAINNQGTLNLNAFDAAFAALSTVSAITVAAEHKATFNGDATFGADLTNNGTAIFKEGTTTTLNNSAKLVNANAEAQKFAGTLVVNHAYTESTIADTIASGDWGFKKGDTNVKIGSTPVTMGNSFTVEGTKLWLGTNKGYTGVTNSTIVLKDTVTTEDYKNFTASSDIRATYEKFDGTIEASGDFGNASIFGEYGTLDLVGTVTAKYVFGGTLGALTSGSKSLNIDYNVTATGIFGRDQILTSYERGKNITATAEATTAVTVTAAANVTFLVGGSLLNGNGVYKVNNASNTTALTVSSASAVKLATGGSIVGGRIKLTETNAITTTLSSGTYDFVAGAGYLQRRTATLNHTGDIALTISGGTYGSIYGGAAASEPQFTLKAKITGNISITIDTSANTVSMKYLFGGNSGKDRGQIIGNTTITFTGAGNKLTFAADDGGVCGGSAVKASHSNAVTGKTRTLAFNSFSGDFAAPVIESFDAIALTNGSTVNFTSKNLALAEVHSWSLDNDTSLTWNEGYENSFKGDTLNFSGTAAIHSSEKGDELFLDLCDAAAVTLNAEEATWNDTAQYWASEHYKLAYDTSTHTLAVGTLA